MRSFLTVIVGICLLLPSFVASRPGLLVTAPSVFLSDSTEKICVTCHAVDFDVRGTFTLTDGQSTELEQHTTTLRSGKGACIPFVVPRLVTRRVNLVVTATSLNTSIDYNFEQTRAINVNLNSLTTFIESDKPQYKPGQTVKFRILSVDSALRPHLDPVSSVFIQDPSGTRLAQWTDVETQKGLVSLEMELSDQPVLGTWKISADVAGTVKTQNFEVKEYVLPKFEIVITPPGYLTVRSPMVTGTICAKYTYGQPVRGLLHVKTCVRPRDRYHVHPVRPCVEGQREINGCDTFAFNSSDVMLLGQRHSMLPAWNSELVIEATVTEEGTGVVINATHVGPRIVSHAARIEVSGTRDYYKPGLTYYGRGLVKKPDGSPYLGQLVNGWMEFNGRPPYRQNVTTDENGAFVVTVPPEALGSGQDMHNLRFTLPSFGWQHHHTFHEIYADLDVKPWFSPSGSYLQIDPITEVQPCEGSLNARLALIVPPQLTPVDLHYTVMSGGDIVYSDRVEQVFSAPPPGPSSRVRTADLTVPLSPRMSGHTTLLVYYLRDDAEVIADSVQFKVTECMDNEVSISFAHSQRVPGVRTRLNIRADPFSLCAVGVVDKSVHILGGANQLTHGKVFSSLQRFDIDENSGVPEDDTHCSSMTTEEETGMPDINQERPFEGRRPERELDDYHLRSKRSTYQPDPEKYDSGQAFTVVGMVTLTDLTVVTKPCVVPRFAAYDLPFYESGRRDFVRPPPVEDTPMQSESVRTYFPETWLWELHDVGSEGELSVTKEVPHTITDWVGGGFCTSVASGLGVAQPVMLRAFQPFFLSFTLPYSVVRGERVRIPVSVFNYLNECLMISPVLRHSRAYKLVSGLRSQELLVCGQEKETVYYTIQPRVLGDVNITVRAVSVVSDEMSNDVTMSDQVGVRDAVTRQLLVEAEGKEEEFTFSAFMCPSDDETLVQSTNLTLPRRIVPGSASATVSIIGDVMGPTLSGLDRLLRMPTGCGEQNMVLFAPNIFVMQYLTATEQVTADIQEKSLRYMRTGYQRELTYKHTDNSYSAFGNRDPEGSMWLTAFVVKSFAQAKPFIFVDDQQLQASIEWFKSKQLDNGCFPQWGRVLHKEMKGGIDGGSPAALTAFVLVAMLEAGLSTDEPAVVNALICLSAQPLSDTYSLVVTTYAFALANDPQQASLLARLEALAITEDGMTHWESHHHSASVDVEMTAYVLMTYLKGPDPISRVLPIVRWLSAQRNAYGGFSSTQDTIVALQALAQFASVAYGDGVDLEVNVVNNSRTELFQVTDDNSLLLQRQEIAVPSVVEFQVSGSGCCLVQANMRYNVPDISGSEDYFLLHTNVSRVNNECKLRDVNICTRYLESDGASNMAVVEVKMVSGWLPHEDSLKRLRGSTQLGVKRVEVDTNYVHFYFDELTSDLKCWTLRVQQDIEVERTQPAIVNVFDYYEKEKITVKEYSIRPIRRCVTVEEEALEDVGGELPGNQQSERRRPRPRGQGAATTTTTTTTTTTPQPFSEICLFDEMGPSVATRTQTEPPCPQCLSSSPDDLMTLVCSASHVYKTTLKSYTPGLANVRLVTDLRVDASNRSVNLATRLLMPESCICPPVTGSEKGDRMLILTTTDIEETNRDGRRRGRLTLDPSTIVIATGNQTDEIERSIKRAQRRRRTWC